MVAILFFFGLIIGSFLNVCAYRIPKKQSVVFPPSACPSCQKPIKPYDNIPLLSYVILRGKCRYCEAKISPQYFVVELITGLLFVATYLYIGLDIKLIVALTFVAILLLVSVIDMRLQIIPNSIIIFGLTSGIIFLGTNFFGLEAMPLIKIAELSFYGDWSLIGFLGGGLIIYVIAIVAKLIMRQDAMGGGDVKLAAFMGLYLGLYVFLALFLGFLFGALVSGVMLGAGKVKKRQPIAFGPFLALGGLITLFFGAKILSYYLQVAGL
ncbi:MAG: prepilin peptidase [Actinobacteria bacterium]|nr:MAG: prepilin peptidase [Actinomycetota bacterium]